MADDAMQIIMEIQQNPMAMGKYANDPEVSREQEEEETE